MIPLHISQRQHIGQEGKDAFMFQTRQLVIWHLHQVKNIMLLLYDNTMLRVHVFAEPF